MIDQANRRLCVGAALAICCLLGPPAYAQRDKSVISIKDLHDLQDAFVRVAYTVRPSTVAIKSFDIARATSRSGQAVRFPRSHGSGAIIRHDGYILTNTHVIEDGQEFVVILHDGREFEAELVQADQRSDLAVLKINAVGLKAAKYGIVDDLKPGHWCFVAGNPFGLANSDGNTAFTYGIISAVHKDLSGELNAGIEDEANRRYYGNLLQTSATINPGNSGGPLFNLDGRMVGVVTAIATRSGVSEGLGYAIPLTKMNQSIIDRLRQNKVVEYGYMGIQIGQPEDRGGPAGRRARGAEINGFPERNSPAAQALLRKGDVIVEFNGQPVGSPDELIRLVGSTPAGQATTVVYLRNGDRNSAEITLMARPVNPVGPGQALASNEPKTAMWRGAWLQEPTVSQLEEFNLTRRDAGIAVVRVDSGSEADKAGLNIAEMILELDGIPIHSLSDFEVAEAKAGDRIKLKVHGQSGRRTVRMPFNPNNAS